MPTYEQRINALAKRYDKRIRKILANVKETFLAAGWQPRGNVNHMSDDSEHSWDVAFIPRQLGLPWKPGDNAPDGAVWVTVQLGEQREHEGEGSGVTFHINVNGIGGLVLGGITPGNYTEDCWLKLSDKDAIEERFKILEDADPAEILDLLK